MTDHTERALVAERAAHAGAEVAAAGFRSGIAVETKGNKTDYVTQADRDAQARVIESLREEFPEDAVVGEEESVEPRSTENASGEYEVRNGVRTSKARTGSEATRERRDEPRAEDALKEVPESGPVWVVDPIDGTNNFVADIQIWATSVAAVVDGEPVAAANVLPALDDVYVSSEAGATLNGAPISVSEREDPETFVVAPTIWWDFDRRDEYADACRAIVERFGDMRRFGCAQATLSMVAAGQLEGTLTNVEVNPWDSVAGVHLVRQAGGTVTDVHGDRWVPGADGLVASNGTAHDELLAAAQEIGANE